MCGYDVVTERRDVTRCIGYLPAEVRMYGHMTAAENLDFFAKLSGVSGPRKAVAETLDYLDCADLAKRRVGSFSTGMRQRIGIAQAIVHRPKVLFIDKPTQTGRPLLVDAIVSDMRVSAISPGLSFNQVASAVRWRTASH